MTPPGLPRLSSTPLRTRLVLATVGVLVLVIVALLSLGGLYTDLLWFRSVGASDVFTTVLGAKLTLFLLAGFLVAAAVVVNVVIAYRLRPTFRPFSAEQQNLDRYRLLVEPRKWLALVLLSLVVFLFAGLSAVPRWRTWLQWRNAVDFGREDAQFGRDISYFVFDYPFQRMVLNYLFAAVVIALIAAAVTHYLFGALRIQTPGEKLTPAAKAHVSVLVGLFLLLKAVSYWLDRYGLAFSPRGVVTGPSYTDVNAVLPAKTILMVIAVICAGIVIANLFFRGWTLPAVAVGAMVVSAIVIGGIYPALIQQFRVKPNEADREQKYIARMIESTQFAYGITDDDVETREYDARTTVQPGQLRGDADTTASIRLLDPNVVPDTYDQLQQIRGFYGFPDLLDIDRYRLSNRQVDTVVAVRELDLSGLSSEQDNWINRYTVFTHGFGFVAAPGNRIDVDGKPLFIERDIPPTGQLGDYEPRIYFGESSPQYSVVGAPQGAPSVELDRPDERSPTGQVNTTYRGKGGVPIGSAFNRLLYSLKFREKNLLLSSRLNSESKILYIRDPRERVEKVAPWLKLDGDPYPAVIDGRIQWIVDGYTVTSRYPYSERTSLSEATQDTLTTTTEAFARQADDRVNYIRNAVKATVDAYDGTVTLYAWDEDDPLLKVWRKAFPDVVKDKAAIPASLMSHLRYPEDLFKVQRLKLTKFHVEDAGAFYGGQDFWRVPLDPTQKTADGAQLAISQPPYYLTLRMPGQSAATFSLTSSLVPRRRANLAAFVAVNSDPGPDYGTIRVLTLPGNTAIGGPQQVDNDFKSFPKASESLNLLSRGGSQVTLGNLLTLPVGGGLLYVEPVYVKGTGETAYPRLQKVLAAFGDSVAYENTLQEALDAVFRGASGVTPPTTPGTPTPRPSPGPGGTLSPDLRAAIDAVQNAYRDAVAAFRRGDFVAYGQAQARLGQAIERLEALESGSGSGASPSPSPSPARP